VTGRSVAQSQLEALSALSLQTIKARAELAEARKIIAAMTPDSAERQRLWRGTLDLLADGGDFEQLP
jgi:hypothetical protein